MMPMAQPATDNAGEQIITTRAVGTALSPSAQDAPTSARPVPAAPSAATSERAAAAAVDSATAPAASAPEATIARNAIPAPGITPPRAAAPAPAVPAPIPVTTPDPALTPAAPTRPSWPGPRTAPSVTAAHSSTWQANLARLEGLAEVLIHHGLRARLMTPPGRVPSLHVVNPSAAALAEDVYAGRGQDGMWWFWWSWAERIAVGEDLETAASMIERVLAASS